MIQSIFIFQQRFYNQPIPTMLHIFTSSFFIKHEQVPKDGRLHDFFYFNMTFLVEFSLDAVRLIFISQMKSSGIMCSSSLQQEGQHAFLFSLRSRRPNPIRKLEVVLDFQPGNKKPAMASSDEKTEQANVFDPSKLLPCFSKGCQAKFKAFVSASELQSFEQENKAIVRGRELESQGQFHSDEITEARPRSNYCQICKETFSDYLKHLNHPAHIRKFDAQSKNAMVDEFVNKLNSTDLSAARARRFVADEDDMDSYRSCSKVRVIQIQNTRTPMRLSSSNNLSAHRTSVFNFN